MANNPGQFSADSLKAVLFIAGSDDPMWIFDVETLSFLEVNQAAIVKYGYTREEFLQMTILDIRPAEDVPLLLRHVVHPTACGPSNLEQWRHQRKDGTILTSKSPASIGCSMAVALR